MHGKISSTKPKWSQEECMVQYPVKNWTKDQCMKEYPIKTNN